MDPIAQLEEMLRLNGIDPASVEPVKSTFQENTEVAAMILTVLMSEIDALRARIETLERGVPK